MWVTKLLNFPVKKQDFLPKNDPIWPKIGIFVYCWLIWCIVGGLAGGCGTGCISQDTYLLYQVYMFGKKIVTEIMIVTWQEKTDVGQYCKILVMFLKKA